MATAPQFRREEQRTAIRFGVFELDARNSELRRRGIRVRLQTKPLQILMALLETPGSVVSREDLRRRLWSEDTFVDFERSLNTAVNRVRIALGDSAENPRFIETVAGAGYRFIAPLNECPAAPEPSAVPVRPVTVIRRVWVWPAVAAAVLASIATWVFTSKPPAREVRFRALTFGRGQVHSAGFAGASEVVYSARWADGPARLFVTNFLSPESRNLGIEGMTLAAVSRTGELALLKGGLTSNITGSTLYRVPMNSGEPLQIDSHVMSADWSPDGRTLAVVRAINGSNQVEFPPGRVLHTTPGWVGDARVAPDGRAVAFIDHPARHDDSGDLKVAIGASVRTISAGWGQIDGLEWNSSGAEVWFTASRSGGPATLWAVNVSSREQRAIMNFPAAVALLDWTHEQGGRMLFATRIRRLEMAGRLRGDDQERSLTWFDWSRIVSISADGGMVLFDESGEAVETHPVAYLYRRQDDSTVRLGEGLAQGLMPDGQSAILLNAKDRGKLRLVALGSGQEREIPAGDLKYQWVRPMPDGRRAVALATDAGGSLGLWLITLDSTARPVRIAPSIMVRNCAVSPDGKRIAVLAPDGRLRVFSIVDGFASVDVPVHAGRLAPIHWSRDGQWLFVQHLDNVLPAMVSRVRVSTGEIRPWKEIVPADRFGVNSVTGIVIAEDEDHYAYSCRRVVSSLFAAEGW